MNRHRAAAMARALIAVSFDHDAGSADPEKRSTPETIRLRHRTGLAERVSSARMLVMQENGELRSDGFAPSRHGFFKEMILHALRQAAPYPHNSLAQGSGQLIRSGTRE
jgi:hypothetical protein